MHCDDTQEGVSLGRLNASLSTSRRLIDVSKWSSDLLNLRLVALLSFL